MYVYENVFVYSIQMYKLYSKIRIFVIKNFAILHSLMLQLIIQFKFGA
jgi:hypothetical protein